MLCARCSPPCRKRATRVSRPDSFSGVCYRRGAQKVKRGGARHWRRHGRDIFKRLCIGCDWRRPPTRHNFISRAMQRERRASCTACCMLTTCSSTARRSRFRLWQLWRTRCERQHNAPQKRRDKRSSLAQNGRCCTPSSKRTPRATRSNGCSST